MSNDPRFVGWKPGQALHVKAKNACKWCEGRGSIVIDEDEEEPIEVECAKCGGEGFRAT